MMNNSTKTSILYKAHFNKGSTHELRETYEEMFDSYKHLFTDDILTYGSLIPKTTKDLLYNEVAKHATKEGVISYDESSYKRVDILKRWINVELTPVSPNCDDAFVVMVDGKQLRNIVPYDFSEEGWYNYKLTIGGREIPFGVNDWVLDTNSAILTFYNGVPIGVSALTPPKLSFWQYVGPVGERHYLDVVGLETEPIEIRKGISIYDVSEQIEDAVGQISENFFADNKFRGSDTSQGIGLQYNLIEQIIDASTGDSIKGYDSTSKANVVYMLSNKVGTITDVDGNAVTDITCDFASANIDNSTTTTIMAKAGATLKVPVGDGGFIVITNNGTESKPVNVAFEDSSAVKMILLAKENKTNKFSIYTPKASTVIKNVKVPVFVDLIELPPHLKLNQFISSYSDMVTPQFYGPRTKSFVIADNTSSTDIESADLVVYSNPESNIASALADLPEGVKTVYLRDGNYEGVAGIEIDGLTLEGESANTHINFADIIIKNSTVSNMYFGSCHITLDNATLKDCIVDNTSTVTTTGMSTIIDTHINSTLEIDGDAFVTASHISSLDIASKSKNILIDTSFINHMLRCPKTAKVDSSYVVDWSSSSAAPEQHPATNVIPYYKNFDERVYAELPTTLRYNYANNKIEVLTDSENFTIQIRENGELFARWFYDDEVPIRYPDKIKTQIEKVYGVHADTVLDKERPENIAEAIKDLYWSKADLQNGKLPIDQLPDSVAYGGLAFVGMWSFEDHEGHYPTFEDTSKAAMSDDKYRGLQPGWFFIVKASNIEDDPAAPQYSVDENNEPDGRVWTAGDWIVWNGDHFDYEYTEGIPASTLNNKILVTDSEYDGKKVIYGLKFSHSTSDYLYIYSYNEDAGKNKVQKYICSKTTKDPQAVFIPVYENNNLKSFSIGGHEVSVRYDRTEGDAQYLQLEAGEDSSLWLDKIPYDLFNKQFVVMKEGKSTPIKLTNTVPASQVLYCQNGRPYSYKDGSTSFGTLQGALHYNYFQAFSYVYGSEKVSCYKDDADGNPVETTKELSKVVTLVFTGDETSEKYEDNSRMLTKGKLYVFKGTTFYPKALLHYYDLDQKYYTLDEFGMPSPLEASVPLNFSEASYTFDVDYIHKHTEDVYDKVYLDHIEVNGKSFKISEIFQGTKPFSTMDKDQGYLVFEGDEELLSDISLLGKKLWVHAHWAGLGMNEPCQGMRTCQKIGTAYGSLVNVESVSLGTDYEMLLAQFDAQVSEVLVTSNWVKVDRSYSEPAMARLPELAPYLGANKPWSYKEGGDGLLDLKLKTIAEAFKLVNQTLKGLQPGKATTIREIDIIETNATTAKKVKYYAVKPGILDVENLELKEAFDVETGEVAYESYRDNKNDLDNCFYCGGESDIYASDTGKKIEGLTVDRFDPYTKFNLGFQKNVQQAAQFEGVISLTAQEDYAKVYNVMVNQFGIEPRYESDTEYYEGSSHPFVFEARKFNKTTDVEVEMVYAGDDNEAHYADINANQINEVLTANKLAGLSYLPFGAIITTSGKVLNAVKYGSIPEDFVTLKCFVGDTEAKVAGKYSLEATDEDGTLNLIINSTIELENEEVNSMLGDLVVKAIIKNFNDEDTEVELIKVPNVYAVRKEAIATLVSSGAIHYPTLSKGEYSETLFGGAQSTEVIFKNTNELMFVNDAFRWVEPCKVLKAIDNRSILYDEVTDDGCLIEEEPYRFVTFCKDFNKTLDVCGFMVKLDMDEEPEMNQYTGQLKDMTLQVCATDGSNENLQNANELIPAFFRATLEAEEPCLHSGKSTTTDRRISFGRAVIPLDKVYVRIGIKKGSNLAVKGIDIH